MDGYLRKNAPDVGWWMTRLYEGAEYRKKYAREADWSRWREYYRGEWRRDVLPRNLFYTMVRTIVPRVYFRNPSVSVSPTVPGLDAMVFAQILGRVDNILINKMKVKKEIKRIVQDGFMFGTAFGKIGFGGMFTATPDPEHDQLPVNSKGQTMEYSSYVQENMPWFRRAHPGQVIVPSGLSCYEDSRWVAHKITRPLDEVLDDPRLENTKQLKSNVSRSIFSTLPRPHEPSVPTVDLYEIRDAATGKVIILSDDGPWNSNVHYVGDDLLAEQGFPLLPLIFNEDDEVFWGVPDSCILEPHQLEVNEIRTQVMQHRRISLVKILYESDKITQVELEKMLAEGPPAGIQVSDIEGVKPLQIGQIPNDLFLADERVMQDVRETLGFSRNQFGEYKPGSGDTTATEAMIVRMASEIRVDERRDMVADLLTDMVESMHKVIFSQWGRETVVQLTGPGGVPVWVKYTGEMLRQAQYSVKVDPDSSVPETKQLREQRAVQMYQLLKTNPLIDPVRLTQYLLREAHGVQFDDMMRMLPPTEGGNGAPGSPVDIQQYGGLINQGLQQLALQGPQGQPQGQGGEGA